VQLLLQQLLRFSTVLDPNKTVIPLLVSNAGLIRLPSQPLAAIETNVNAEGKPSLDPYMQLPKLRVCEVVIQMGALGML